MPSKGKNTHPGQARGSARKRMIQLRKRASELQKKYRAKNYAQWRQDQVKCEIVIKGLEKITGTSDWKSAFSDSVQVYESSKKYFGSTKVKTLDYLRINADLNQVSFERGALSILLSLGYELEELEVEFDDEDRAQWGTCVWYKDHPSYHDQESSKFWKGVTSTELSFLIAMFKTEHAGDQKFTLYSMQMFAAALLKQPVQILLHKTLVFRKVVLSLPRANYAEAA